MKPSYEKCTLVCVVNGKCGR